MSNFFFKGSIVKRTLLNHVVSVSSFAFFLLAIMYLQVREEEFVLIFFLPVFVGFFFIGILIYGFFGVLIRGIILTNMILKNVDLNSNYSKEEIKIFVLFSWEVIISVLFFFVVLRGFPEAFDLHAIFEDIATTFLSER